MYPVFLGLRSGIIAVKSLCVVTVVDATMLLFKTWFGHEWRCPCVKLRAMLKYFKEFNSLLFES